MPSVSRPSLSNPLVRASRAGDRFHYCWAAKRSLLLLHPEPELERIVIEGDDTSGADGEYSLDMTEVYRAGSAFDRIMYQFKYSVARVREPFGFSELKKTIVGFAENYQFAKGRRQKLHYAIVSNRGVSNELKSCVETIAKGERAKGRTANSFYRSVKLQDGALKRFCQLLEFRDVEEDLEAQFQNLRSQAATYTAGIPTLVSMQALVDMVACKAQPKSDGVIAQEDVLSYFCKGITSRDAFYPARAKFGPKEDWVETAGYKDVRSKVLNAQRNVFIHAPGGVGKTVTLRMLARDTPPGSAAILFDCFAAGEYSNRLQYRHAPEKACVQIANELAAMALCEPLVVDNGMSPQSVFEAWGARVKCAVARLRQNNADARLYLFVDAADNSHMIAAATQESCFVDFVLDSSPIDGCTVVLSARTERMNDFWPDRDSEDIELVPFAPQEVESVLRKKFSDATAALANDLFVRTSGLPRIVAGILADCMSLKDVADAVSFAPLKDYDSYLSTKFDATQKRYSKAERKNLVRLCRCLVLLPPNVPIKVLSTAAKVTEEFILSFISDWERPLWHSQEHVHFRDEPTETWFKNRFGEGPDDLQEVIDLISPLSVRFVYVARSLPELFLRAKAYDKLEALAESDESLPNNIHVAEKKQLKLERLRFAVSAMIRSKKYAAAMRLSLLAGDMVSESGRRNETLRRDLVFASRVLPKETVSELAATRQVKLNWPGSENLCTGVLLSSLDDTRNEARIHIESALRWLLLHLDQVQAEAEKRPHPLYSDYSYEASLFGRACLRTEGPLAAVNEIRRWNWEETRYRAARCLADDCVSLGEKELVEGMLRSSKDVFILLGLLGEALDYGERVEIPGWRTIVRLVQTLPDNDARWRNSATPVRLSIARFAVWIARQKEGRRTASKLLEKAVLPFARFRTHEIPFDSNDALPFYVLATIGQGKICSVSDILRAIKAEREGIPDYELREAQNRFDILLPVYVKMVESYLAANSTDMASVLKEATPLLDDYRLFHQDKRQLFIDLASWLSVVAAKDENCLFEFVNQNARVGLVSAAELFALARQLFRRGHLKTGDVCLSRGRDCFELCRKDPETSPDELSDLYIQAAKAYYPYDPNDARVYYSDALDVLSKCGDELLPRWNAVTAIARRLSQPDIRDCVPRKLVYEFTRCGEYVRKCVCRDKYYNRSEVFSILADFDPAYAWATYSRWRDRGLGSFCYDLNWVLEDLLKKGAMTIEEAWSFRSFDDCGDSRAIANVVAGMESSREFKKKAFDYFLMVYGKTGCSNREMESLQHLAEQLNVQIPTWVQPQTEHHSNSLVNVENPRDDGDAVVDFDGKDQNWAYTTLTRLQGIWDSGRKCETFFSKIQNLHACDILKQLATDTRIDQFTINNLLAQLPDNWRKKPGVQEAMPRVLKRLVARYVTKGEDTYVGGLLSCADEFGIRQMVTEEFLSCMSNVFSLGSESYFQIVKTGLSLLTNEEVVDVFGHALQRVADGMDSGFGDGEWTPSIWPDKPFEEITKDVLWTAMGDPDVKIRWMATHCVVNELLRAPDENVSGYVKCLSRSDFAPCVAKNLPTYVYFSRMHFLLALAKVSKQIAPAIRKNISELVNYLHGEDHVLIRYCGWRALVETGVSSNKLRGINPIDDITIKSVVGYSLDHQTVLNPDIKAVITQGGWFPMQYDFEKYWLHSLASVFGLQNDDCPTLLRWAASSLWNGKWSLRRDQDPRNDQFYSARSTRVSDSNMPDISDYNFYLSYHSLMVLAGKLLKCQPVFKRSGNVADRFSAWMDRLLPLFAPDLSTWQSDVRGNMPAGECELRSMIDVGSLQEVDLKRILQMSGQTDRILIDGHWQVGDGIKMFVCSLSCALVSQRNAVSTREDLRRLKDPMSLALPTFFDRKDNDWRNHGEYDWRGLFESEHRYPCNYLDEKDPAAGGLHLIRFNVAQTIYKELQLKDGNDYISVLRQDGSPALVSWYWSNGSFGRDEQSGAGGRVLEATSDFLIDLCNRYRSELIIELAMTRYKITYRYDYPSRDEDEACYRYVLFSPTKGLY